MVLKLPSLWEALFNNELLSMTVGLSHSFLGMLMLSSPSGSGFRTACLLGAGALGMGLGL